MVARSVSTLSFGELTSGVLDLAANRLLCPGSFDAALGIRQSTSVTGVLQARCKSYDNQQKTMARVRYIFKYYLLFISAKYGGQVQPYLFAISYWINVLLIAN